MARRCFEVARVIFKLCYLEQEKSEGEIVFEKFVKQLEKYASNTTVRDYFKFVEKGNVVLHIELQKNLKINTVNNILSQMFADKYTCSTNYNGKMNRMTVTVEE